MTATAGWGRAWLAGVCMGAAIAGIAMSASALYFKPAVLPVFVVAMLAPWAGLVLTISATRAAKRHVEELQRQNAETAAALQDLRALVEPPPVVVAIEKPRPWGRGPVQAADQSSRAEETPAAGGGVGADQKGWGGH